ncbi:hypothetical protein RQP53_17425 [Paucibacter sp. APW11]|uniref:DUF1120 domain-containing protein n=1 Tax=Roseateles aquae TaxID=3077235 RepID=A0ABU3PG30_9BURK|nr:hypothetical protein [Paucibacter sp. APW11]MDT9001063.1 hypothetical protein [Paucibacter sp. APW11]
MNKLTPFRSALALAACLAAAQAGAHVGISNVTTPISVGGQATFGIANTTSEILFNIPHGCTAAESVPSFSGANLDTSKIEVTIPAAIVSATTVASLRPAMDGLFGTVSISAADADGNVKLSWVRKSSGAGEQNAATADNQLYKISVRLKFPAAASAADVAIKKYQFRTVQTCKSNGVDYVMDWGSANSPTIIVFPDKRKGFNKFSVDASTVADFTTTGSNTLAGKLKSYFGDAAIVWVGKSGYSANPNTAAKISALAAKDTAYSDLGSKAGGVITATDTIWVKY